MSGYSKRKIDPITARPKTGTAGYTLIELMVVVAIISVLANIAVVQTSSTLTQVRDKRRLCDLRALQQALFMYFTDHDAFPGPTNANVPVSGQQIGVGDTIDAALQPYMRKIPADPRHDGVTYYYAYDPQHMNVQPPNCAGPSAEFIAVLAAKTFEATDPAKLPRATCAGADQGIDTSQYNIALGLENPN